MTETENEVNEKTHIEALISEWKFQNAEGIYTFDRDTMFTKCYQDAYKKGMEANREIDWLTRMNKGYKQQIEHLKKKRKSIVIADCTVMKEIVCIVRGVMIVKHTNI